MPKPGAFDKAKVKKSSGGFGASKAGRFDGPKESCDLAPSSSSYNAHEHGSISATAQRSASKAAWVQSIKKGAGGSTAGFGSTAKRDSAVNGMKSDAPGPGAYTDGLKGRSSFEQPKRRGKASSWGSTAQHELGAPTPSAYTPDPGVYAAPTGVGSVPKRKGKSSGFGVAKRFDEPAELVQADYAVPGAFDAVSSKLAAPGVAFGARQPRASPARPRTGDSPGPGSYSRPGAFAASVVAGPSSAFASKSQQHATTPSESALGPSPTSYDVTYDKHASKSFHSRAVFGADSALGGAFGSNAPRAPPTAQSTTPGPGEYLGQSAAAADATPSSVFASATQQRAPQRMPSHADDLVYVPQGIGVIKPSGAQNMGFGGAKRGLLDEQAEVAQLRAMLGKA